MSPIRVKRGLATPAKNLKKVKIVKGNSTTKKPNFSSILSQRIEKSKSEVVDYKWGLQLEKGKETQLRSTLSVVERYMELYAHLENPTAEGILACVGKLADVFYFSPNCFSNFTDREFNTVCDNYGKFFYFSAFNIAASALTLNLDKKTALKLRRVIMYLHDSAVFLTKRVFLDHVKTVPSQVKQKINYVYSMSCLEKFDKLTIRDFRLNLRKCETSFFTFANETFSKRKLKAILNVNQTFLPKIELLSVNEVAFRLNCLFFTEVNLKFTV